MNTYIGRQPIYNSDYLVAGYEMFYRSAEGHTANIFDTDAATRNVLTNAISVFGLSNLTDGLPAHINFTRKLLLDNFAYLADPADIVIEVPGGIYLDEALENKLVELYNQGYKLSLNSYNAQNGFLKFNRISNMFHIIRMDLKANNKLQLRDLIRRLRGRYVRLLAERVETEEDFDTALSMNFTLFQGYYFEKPSCLTTEVPLSSTVYGKLFAELSKRLCSSEKCCQIIGADAVLSHMFLNRVLTGMNYSRINLMPQIKRGMKSMGVEGFRRWVCLIFLKQFNLSNTEELPKTAYLRGRFIERLIENSQMPAEQPQGFMVGVFSMLDQIMGVPMEQILDELDLPEEMKGAILGTERNAYYKLLEYAEIFEIATETADSTGLRFPDIKLNIPERRLGLIYNELLKETQATYQGVDTKPITAYQGNIVRKNVSK